MRFSHVLKRIDSHCAGHEEDGYLKRCKCDRVVGRKPLSLHLLFLEAGMPCKSAAEHVVHKELLSDATGYAVRCAQRDFINSIDSSDPLYECVLFERGDTPDTPVEEPRSIPCQSVFARMAT